MSVWMLVLGALCLLSGFTAVFTTRRKLMASIVDLGRHPELFTPPESVEDPHQMHRLTVQAVAAVTAGVSEVAMMRLAFSLALCLFGLSMMFAAVHLQPERVRALSLVGMGSGAFVYAAITWRLMRLTARRRRERSTPPQS